jgi:hypothetical protein
MPDKEGKQEGPGNEAPVAEGTQPSDKDESTPGTAHKGGFGQQEADASADDVPTSDEVPGR